MGQYLRERCIEAQNCALTSTLNRTAIISFFGSTLIEMAGDGIRRWQLLQPCWFPRLDRDTASDSDRGLARRHNPQRLLTHKFSEQDNLRGRKIRFQDSLYIPTHPRWI